MKQLAYLNKYLYKYRYRIALGTLFIIISNYFSILGPKIVSYSFDLVKENIVYYRMYNGFSSQSAFRTLLSQGLLIFGILMLLLAILKGVFLYFMRQTIIVMSRLVEYDLKNELYNHYQELDLAFYKRNNTGDMMSRITEDVSRVREYLGPAIMYGINMVILVVMTIWAMVAVSPQLTLFVLLPLPLLSVSIYYVSVLINQKSEKIQEKLADLNTFAQETYSGIRVIKSYVQEKPINAAFEKESAAYKNISLERARIESFFFPLMLLLIGLSTIITIYVGGRGVINGSITPGNIAEFVIYVTMLTWPVTAVGWVASLVQRAEASQKRINQFLRVKPAIKSNSTQPFHLKGEIAFHHVGFTYPDTGIEALKDISFEIKPGQKLAIVGRTGSGKTTIADLLVRMYDADKGTITIDGIPIQKIDLNALRQQVGYVPQDVFLFSETVSGNVAFGSDGKSLEEVQQATLNAVIHHDILGLPQQYDTIVGERGVTLSGGQKQRISIARAFIKNPQLVILDDCLSAVDASTEKAILQNLSTILKEKTAIIITHRVSSLLNFDQILVLDNGHIAEVGTHEELMEKRGLYYEMYERQKIEDRIFD
ncbi:MAG: ABC transporter ATP-binding protein [Chitinophagales bacterium]|nr:ABC transporter ATP-binding protein [Chitinophagales bacterium]